MKPMLLFLIVAVFFNSQPLFGVTSINQQVSGPQPPLKLLHKTPGSQKQTGPAPPLSAHQPAIMNQDIRDIQGPVELPEPKNPWLYGGVAAGLLLLLILAFLYVKRRKPSVPRQLPHEIALAALAKAKEWMNSDNGLLYAQHLSEILRQYIESQFGLRSTRQTTDEFFVKLQTATSPETAALKPHIGSLQSCLECCDLAKFAHLVPDRQNMEKMAEAVAHFIETTRPAEKSGGKK